MKVTSRPDGGIVIQVSDSALMSVIVTVIVTGVIALVIFKVIP